MVDNPKMVQAQKEGKAPLDRIPWAGLAAVARVMDGGAEKYGVRNFLIDPIRASTYIGAIARHALLEWAQGVDEDKDSGEHPLAHVAACCLIVLASHEHGSLIDDRLECQSRDPHSGEVRTQNLITDRDDEKIREALAPFRRYRELTDRLIGLHMGQGNPLSDDEWKELEKLWLKLPKPGQLMGLCPPGSYLTTGEQSQEP